MNKTQYLKELHGYLYTLPEEERDAALKYYEEFFEDAGEENEQSVIADLGSPQSLAQSIIDAQGELSSPYRKWTTAENPPPKAKMSGGMKVWFVILVIFSAPIWIPIAAAAFSVLVAIAVSVFAVWISIGAVVLALLASGVFAIIVGVITLFNSPIGGAAAIGSGLVMFAVGMLMLIPFMLFTTKAIPAMFRGLINACSSAAHRKERRAAREQQSVQSQEQ